LPLFLFTLPAGALADIVDARRLLLVVEIGVIVISAIFAAAVSLHLATTGALLATTFLLGVAGALASPAWAAIVPLLVPRPDLGSGTAGNRGGVRMSGGSGPALGGALIGAFGDGAAFWVFTISNFGIVAALLWWREPQKSGESLPAERLISAVRNGVRF